MKLLIEPSQKNNIDYNCDGLILALQDFSVESFCYFDIDEILEIKNRYNKEVFVKINKNLFNNDIDDVTEILKKINNKIDGVFFYDLAIIEICCDNNLNIPLIWNQTHMVNNYRTCDYYYKKGVEYALLGKEITLDEILDIIKKSKIKCMVEVLSIPSVAHSYRTLITNYSNDIKEEKKSKLKVKEKITGDYYDLVEDKNGTSFFLDKIMNGTSIIKNLYECNCPYIIFREYGIAFFDELVNDTMKYINNKCIDSSYINKYKKLGDSTNFFFKKTIYKVK